MDHSDPLLGETSLLDCPEPDDELGGPMLNMTAVLYGGEGEKVCCETEKEEERESVVIAQSVMSS